MVDSPTFQVGVQFIESVRSALTSTRTMAGMSVDVWTSRVAFPVGEVSRIQASEPVGPADYGGDVRVSTIPEAPSPNSSKAASRDRYPTPSAA